MILEICVDRIESAIAAKAGGADRIEVCGPLCVGGTTPSSGLIDQCVELGEIDVSVMIRPRAGDFHYSQNDIQTMQRDIAIAKSAGASGIVIGLLSDERKIDTANLRRLIDLARPMQVTFHRAFDVVIDPLSALDELIELKVDRLLTSGQAPTALAGAELIQRIAQQAGGKIEVMAGSGINASNVAEIARTTNVTDIHTSASEPAETIDYPIDFGGRVFTTSTAKVREIRQMLDVAAEK